MSQTKHEKKRQQKAQARKNEIRRKANIAKNVPADRYRLDIELDGEWKIGVKAWAQRKSAELHQITTEALRAKGQEIARGRVIDTLKGVVIISIPESKAKGAAPDKIDDGVKAADVATETIAKD
jgi:hypothetical protein